MKKDLSYNENTYKNWKKKVEVGGIKEISKTNSKLIIDYILDMETGQNVSKVSKKGARSFGRLNVLKNKLIQTIKLLEGAGIKDITKITEKQAHLFFHDINTGKIKNQDGIAYVSPQEFVKTFKSFWNWWIKINRKKGIVILNITEDLEVKAHKINFVYITKTQMEQMLPYLNEDEQILTEFIFDSLARFPTETLSLTANCVYEKDNEVWINIPDEVSKTFGRTFNLLYCGEALVKYIKKKKLKPEDYIFQFTDNNSVSAFNKKLKQVAFQLFGDKISHPKANGKYNEISGYDLRHSGAIHLRILAQKNNSISLDAIRQRGGWRDFNMLNYYTQLIGLSGEIKKEALLIEEDKSKMEKQIDEMKKQIEALQVQMVTNHIVKSLGN